MRTTTKLKKILTDNTIGVSLTEGEWHLTVINMKEMKRSNFSSTSFSKVVDNAFKNLKPNKRGERREARGD